MHKTLRSISIATKHDIPQLLHVKNWEQCYKIARHVALNM